MAVFGQNFYEDQPYQDFYNLSNLQSLQSTDYGNQAARYADPFMGERANYQERLRNLIANPGSQESSPFYKYLMDTQMNAVNAHNAATGNFRSGRGAMALQDRAAGVATQSYFPQVAALTQLAQGGASPAAAGLAYARGTERSQDYAQLAAAARAAGRQPPPQQNNQTPWWMQPTPTQTPAATPANNGYGLPYGGLYGGMSGQVSYNTPGYTPSSNAGTGYVSTDYGKTDFGGGGYQYTPSYQPDQNTYDPYASYDTSSYGDFGGGDYGGDYGGY